MNLKSFLCALAAAGVAFGAASAAHAQRAATTLPVWDATQNKDTLRKITTSLNEQDGFKLSLCDKTFMKMGVLPDDARTFEGCGGAKGTGTYVDGQDRGTFEWGYALGDDGKVRVKTYKEWEDPQWGKDAINGDKRAVMVLMRYTGGARKGKSYGTVSGPQEGSVYQYMFPGYFGK
ncbi:MAG: hypothetical protein EOO30_09265 [Comamonadaceae bacterium]|nr:MAG: hypothetical protein EOO30_09265 [Comamonadaceae bacterium]